MLNYCPGARLPPPDPPPTTATSPCSWGSWAVAAGWAGNESEERGTRRREGCQERREGIENEGRASRTKGESKKGPRDVVDVPWAVGIFFLSDLNFLEARTLPCRLAA